MTTLRDIANVCGVDVSTVSKVIHDRPIRVAQTTRSRILDAARKLNYRPNALARSLRTRQSGAIVMALRSTSSYVYPEIIDGAYEAAEEEKIVLFLMRYSSTATAGRDLISTVQEGRADGVMFDEWPSPEFAQELNRANIPYVSLNRHPEFLGHYVVLDDVAGFKAQAEYLVSLGHKRIGFVYMEPESAVSTFCRASFVEALAESGQEVPPNRLWPCDFEGLGVSALADSILSQTDRPTAIATASLAVAVQLSAKLQIRGLKVPEDVSIIGYHEAAQAIMASPGLTTVKMPSRIQGVMAVKKLVAQMKGERVRGEVVQAPPVIIERESCANIA